MRLHWQLMSLVFSQYSDSLFISVKILILNFKGGSFAQAMLLNSFRWHWSSWRCIVFVLAHYRHFDWNYDFLLSNYVILYAS